MASYKYKKFHGEIIFDDLRNKMEDNLPIILSTHKLDKDALEELRLEIEDANDESKKKKKRDISLFWSEKVIVSLDALQIFSLLWSMMRTLLPSAWINKTRFITFFNLDFASLVWEEAAATSESFRLTYMTFYTMIPCVIVISYILYVLALISSFRNHAENRAVPQKICLFLLNLLYLPVGTAVAPFAICADNTPGMTDTSQCWGALHSLLAVFSLTVMALYFVGLPVFLVYHAWKNAFCEGKEDHERWLQLKETEFLLELTEQYKVNQLWLIASYKRDYGRVYHRALMMCLKFLLVLILSVGGSNAKVQTLFVFLILSFAAVWTCFKKVYRCVSTSALQQIAIWTLVLNAALGYLSSLKLTNPLLLPNSLSIMLTVLNCIALSFYGLVILVCFFLGVEWTVNGKTVKECSWGHEQMLDDIRKGSQLFAKMSMRHHELVRLDLLRYMLKLLKRHYSAAQEENHLLQFTLLDLLEELADLYQNCKERSLLPNPMLEACLEDFSKVISRRFKEQMLMSKRKRRILLKLLALRYMTNGRTWAFVPPEKKKKSGKAGLFSSIFSRRAAKEEKKKQEQARKEEEERRKEEERQKAIERRRLQLVADESSDTEESDEDVDEMEQAFLRSVGKKDADKANAMMNFAALIKSELGGMGMTGGGARKGRRGSFADQQDRLLDQDDNQRIVDRVDNILSAEQVAEDMDIPFSNKDPLAGLKALERSATPETDDLSPIRRHSEPEHEATAGRRSISRESIPVQESDLIDLSTIAAAADSVVEPIHVTTTEPPPPEEQIVQQTADHSSDQSSAPEPVHATVAESVAAVQESTKEEMLPSGEELLEISQKLLEEIQSSGVQSHHAIPLKELRSKWRSVIRQWEQAFKDGNGRAPTAADKRSIRSWYQTYKDVSKWAKDVEESNATVVEATVVDAPVSIVQSETTTTAVSHEIVQTTDQPHEPTVPVHAEPTIEPIQPVVAEPPQQSIPAPVQEPVQVADQPVMIPSTTAEENVVVETKDSAVELLAASSSMIQQINSQGIESVDPVQLKDLRIQWRTAIRNWEQNFKAVNGRDPGVPDKRTIKSWFETYKQISNFVSQLPATNEPTQPVVQQAESAEAAPQQHAVVESVSQPPVAVEATQAEPASQVDIPESPEELLQFSVGLIENVKNNGVETVSVDILKACRQSWRKHIRSWEQNFKDTHNGVDATVEDKKTVRMWYQSYKEISKLIKE
eukprot:GILJ01006270.1.p1 GENE.GILJ01006270.1~~GILJ01006270.1.p1  ORF type:complete len:1218 (-),score=254.12 GILJ01006270.1:320-3973(-)